MKLKIILSILSLTLSFSTFSQERLRSFSLTTYGESEEVILEEIKADKIVINFFASWCVACVKEIPELNALKNRVKKGEKVVFLAINAGEKDYKIAKFLKKTGFSYQILRDQGLKYSLSVGVDKLPRTIVLDSQKNIIYSSDLPPEKI